MLSTAQVNSNHDYELSVADVLEWEKRHGQIPSGALVSVCLLKCVCVCVCVFHHTNIYYCRAIRKGIAGCEHYK